MIFKFFYVEYVNVKMVNGVYVVCCVVFNYNFELR